MFWDRFTLILLSPQSLPQLKVARIKGSPGDLFVFPLSLTFLYFRSRLLKCQLYPLMWKNLCWVWYGPLWCPSGSSGPWSVGPTNKSGQVFRSYHFMCRSPWIRSLGMIIRLQEIMSSARIPCLSGNTCKWMFWKKEEITSSSCSAQSNLTARASSNCEKSL